MGRSLGFGSAPLDSFAQLRLAFASAPGHKPLTSPRRTTPRIIMQKARSQGPEVRRPLASPLLPLVGTQFQVLFHPPSGVLFTFPSRYLFTIGHRSVFSLGRRSSQIQPGFLVSRPTQVRHHASTSDLSPTGLSPPTAELPSSIRLDRTRKRQDPKLPTAPPYYPDKATASALHLTGLGSSPFARRYSGNRYCFLFLQVLRCFSSPGSPLAISEATGFTPARFPHSGTPGSMPACSSPRIFAACHALLRPPVPRHPLHALLTRNHLQYSSRNPQNSQKHKPHKPLAPHTLTHTRLTHSSTSIVK